MSDEVVELPIPPSDAVPFERPSGKDWSDVGEETLAGYLSKLAPTLVAHAKLSTVGREAVMRALPTGYVLLQQMRASGSYVDKYLFGHPSGSKFRSVNEFIPHLAFLCARQTDASAVCQCKHCASFSAKKKTNSATPSPAPPSSSAATTPRFEPGKRKQPLAHPLAKTSSRRSSLATGAAHSRSHGSPSASDAEPDGGSGHPAKRLKADDSLTAENDAKANKEPKRKEKRSRSSSIAPPPPSLLAVSTEDVKDEDEAESDEELPPFAKTVMALSSSQEALESGSAVVLTENPTFSTSTDKKPSSQSGTKPLNPLAASLPTDPSKVSTPTSAMSVVSSVPDSQSPAQSSIPPAAVPLAAPQPQQAPTPSIAFSSCASTSTSIATTSSLDASINPVIPAAPPINTLSSISMPFVPNTAQTTPTPSDASQSIAAVQTKLQGLSPALSNSAAIISIPHKLAAAESNSAANGSSASISSETVAAPAQETAAVAPTNSYEASAPKKLGRPSKPSQPQRPKSAPTPAPTRTKQGDPTPPVFRTNEIVYVEVMLTALDTRTTRLTFPPATTTTSGTIDAPVACDISRVHTGCVFWPGIVTRVFTDTAQPVLWTTPILVDTTPAQGVNISSAACFPDTLETLTRQTRTTAAGNKSVAEVVHRRPSYQIGLFAIPNGVVSLPELYLTPFKLVQPPLDLVPRGLCTAHVEEVLRKGAEGTSAMQEGFDYGVLLFFKALLAAREIVSGSSMGQLLEGAEEDGGPQARVGGEVVEEGDLVVVKMPGSGYHGVLKVAYLDLDLNGGKFRVDGNKCHRRKNVEPGIEGLDWIRGGKERFAFGERVKGIEARWIVGRVYPQFPLVTMESDGFLVAADLA